jgi:transposase
MQDRGKPVEEPMFSVLIGLDWGDEKHAWSLHATEEKKREKGELEHTPEVIDLWVTELYQRFPSGSIAVAVEQSKGALVFMLCKYDRLHIFPVPPAMSAGMRKAFRSSGAKSDPGDAALLLDILEKHRDQLRRLSPDSEATRLVQNLVEERRKLVDERAAQNNRLQAQLKMYFPQILMWFEGCDSPLVWALLSLWPTLQALQKVRPEKLRKFFDKHHCRDKEVMESRIEAIGKAMPAIQDQAVIQVKVEVVKVLVKVMEVLSDGIKELDRQIAEAAAAHPDFFIFKSLPGAGAAMAPRLLAAFGSQRERFESAKEVATLGGIAPVIEQSGKTRWIHFRFACPKFLRQTFHEWAGYSLRKSTWARAYYDQQRSRGHGHHSAIRALAFKWIRILFRCWKDRQAYDEQKYLAALSKRGSALSAAVAVVAVK